MLISEAEDTHAVISHIRRSLLDSVGLFSFILQ